MTGHHDPVFLKRQEQERKWDTASRPRVMFGWWFDTKAIRKARGITRGTAGGPFHPRQHRRAAGRVMARASRRANR